jgi:hypothetical protein
MTKDQKNDRIPFPGAGDNSPVVFFGALEESQQLGTGSEQIARGDHTHIGFYELKELRGGGVNEQLYIPKPYTSYLILWHSFSGTCSMTVNGVSAGAAAKNGFTIFTTVSTAAIDIELTGDGTGFIHELNTIE